MHFQHFRSVLFIGGYLLIFNLPGVVSAASTDASGSSWHGWLTVQIKQHPQVVAAERKMKAAVAAADSMEKPLYNPELITEVEREGSDDNYRVGFNQTIDWRDKRASRVQRAGYSRIAARQTYNLFLQEKTAAALQALTAWRAGSHKARLASEQEQQLDTLLQLVKARQQAGDLGPLDAELAYLGLSQQLYATAQAQAQLVQLEAQLKELLPDWSAKQAQLPDAFWKIDQPTAVTNGIDRHPEVIAAQADWDVLQKSAELARHETRAEPTVGINAGKSGSDNVVALTFAMPLHIRNGYDAEARAAMELALSAEAEYLAIRREKQFAIDATRAALGEYQEKYERWQTLMQGRDERSGRLLDQQWHSGDMSTTEYLLALQQRAESLIAGIELRQQFESTRIEWLLQTGQINAALSQLTGRSTEIKQ